jgi:hypothetical protein
MKYENVLFEIFGINNQLKQINPNIGFTFVSS